MSGLLGRIRRLGSIKRQVHSLCRHSLLRDSLVTGHRTFTLNDSSDDCNNDRTAKTAFSTLRVSQFAKFRALSRRVVRLVIHIERTSSSVRFAVSSASRVTHRFHRIAARLRRKLGGTHVIPFNRATRQLPHTIQSVSVGYNGRTGLIIRKHSALVSGVVLRHLCSPVARLIGGTVARNVRSPRRQVTVNGPQRNAVAMHTFCRNGRAIVCVTSGNTNVGPVVIGTGTLRGNLVAPTRTRAVSSLRICSLLFRPNFDAHSGTSSFSNQNMNVSIMQATLTSVQNDVAVRSRIKGNADFAVQLPLALDVAGTLDYVGGRTHVTFPVSKIRSVFSIPGRQVRISSRNRDDVL